MALFELCEHVIRDGLVCRHAVFNGQAVDFAELDAAGLHLVREQVFQHARALLGDGGADAVAAANADDDGVELCIVHKVALGLHAFDAGELGFDQLREFIYCILDVFHWWCPPNMYFNRVDTGASVGCKLPARQICSRV